MAITVASADNVKAVLGAEVSSTWFDLITHASINQWSKYKPVIGVFPSADNGKYGFSLPQWSIITKSFSPLNWTYNKPRGGSAYDEPTRAGDFAGYEHDNSLTFPTIYAKDSDQDKNSILSPSQPAGGVSSNTVNAKMITASSAVRPNISDMALSNFRFGVLVKTPSNTWWIKTNSALLSIGNETTGISFVYSAALIDPSNPLSTYQNLPYGVGNFAVYYVITDTAYADWTQNPIGLIYLLPSGSVTGLTFENSYTFEVEDWVYAATGSMAWTYDDDTYDDYVESVIYMSVNSEPFGVDLDDASFLEFRVYAADGVTNITNNPTLWENGCRLRLFPINANGAGAKTGTVRITGTNCTAYPITVTHQASPATVRVYAGNDTVLTVSNTDGNVVGGLNIAFTPHYVPGGDPTYDVCWLIKVNDIEVYTSRFTGIACQNDVHENLQSIDYGSATWEDGDTIDVFLYYEEAPPIA